MGSDLNKLFTKEQIKKFEEENKGIVLHGADLVSAYGFTMVPNFVLETKKLKSFSKLVYSILLRRAQDKENCWPGQESIAKDAGISLRQVTNAIKELSEKKYITVIRRGHTKTNIYVLHLKVPKKNR